MYRYLHKFANFAARMNTSRFYQLGRIDYDAYCVEISNFS